jgi:hypothetical protein
LWANRRQQEQLYDIPKEKRSWMMTVTVVVESSRSHFKTAMARKFISSITNEITKVCVASYNNFGENTVHTNIW